MSRYEDFLNSQKTLGENSSNQAPTTRYEKFIQNQKLSSLVEYYNSLNNDIYNATKKLNTTGYIDLNTAKKDKNSISAKMTRAENIAKKIVSESEIYGIDAEKLKAFQDEHIKNIDSYKKILGFANDRANYYGQFKDEADYNTQKKNAGYYDKYKNYSVAELAELISKTPEGSEEYDFLTEFRGNKLYDEYSKFTDEQMAEIEAEYNKYYDANGRYQMLERKALNPHMSKITDAELRELEGMRARKREFENKYDYKLIEQVRAQDKAQKEYVLPYLEKSDFNSNSSAIKVYGDKDFSFDDAVKYVAALPSFAWDTNFTRNIDQATNDEKKVFSYIYNTEGEKAAKEWYENLRPTLSYRASVKTQQEWKDFANENIFTGIVSQIASIPANIIKGGVAVSDIISNIAGVEIDPYDSAHTLVQYAPIVRQEVSKNWGPVGSYAYQLGMGIGDFGAQLLLSKGIGKAAGLSSAATSNIALGIMGTGAAADTITTAKLSGASDSQAIALGTMSGIIEVLCEKASIETLFGSSKGKLSYFLKNAFTEASEEGISSVANIITDMIIMSDKSEVETLAQKYLEGFTDSKGVYHKASTKAEALAMAITSKAHDVLLDALGGFISGGVIGGISLTISAIRANKAANNIINKNNTQGLIDLGLEMPKDSVAYDTAVSLKEQLEATTADKAKKTVAKLYDSIRQEIGDVVSKYEGDKDAAAYTDYNRALNQYETLNNLVKSTDNIVAPNSQMPSKKPQVSQDVINEIVTSLKNSGGEYQGYKIKITHHDTEYDTASFTLTKPNGEVIEDKADCNPAGYISDVYDYIARVYIATDTENNAEIQIPEFLKSTVESKSTPELTETEKLVRTVEGKMPKAETTKKETANESAFDEPDVSNKNDTATLLALMEGRTPIKTEQQKYITNIGKLLGVNVVFEDLVKKFAGKGAIPDGYIDDNGTIHLGYSAVSPIQFIFKHELTHFGEKSEYYGNFVEAVVASKTYENWLRKKTGDSSATVSSMQGTLMEEARVRQSKLKQLTPAEQQAEVIADFVGETLFGKSTEVLDSLVADINTKKYPKAIQFLVDFFSYLKKKLSGDAQYNGITLELSRIEDSFKRAIADAAQTNTPTEEAGVRYSADRVNKFSEYNKPITQEDIRILREIGKKSINEFTEKDIEVAQKWAYKFYDQLKIKSPFFRRWFGDWRAYDKTPIEKVDTKRDERKEVLNKDTGWTIKTSRHVHKETSSHQGSSEKTAVKYLPYIDDITQKAVLLDTVISNDDNENSMMYHTFYAYTEVMGYPALLRLRVEELYYYGKKGTGILRRDYILQNIEEKSLSESDRLSRPNQSEKNFPISSISDLFNLVKTYDTEFNPKPVNEALLNDDGTPKVLYHGTDSQFNSFDTNKQRTSGKLNFGKGIYLTPNKNIAEMYTTNGNVMELYAALKNPYVIYSTRLDTTDLQKLSKEFGEEVTVENVDKILQKNNYDGIIARTYNGTDNPINQVVVFDNSKVKSAKEGGNIGTFSEFENDIRYSIPDTKADREYLNAVENGDMETAQRLVDEVAKKAGYTVKVYHGTGNFGFTQFKDGLIFTTNDPSISAGYTNNKGYGRKRSIAEAYTEDNGSVETLIKNAKNVLGWNLHQITEAEHKQYVEDIKQSSAELSDKVNEVWQRESIDALPNLTEELDNDISWVLSLPGSINENIDDVVLYAEDMQRWVEHFNESRERVREYLVKNRDALKDTPAWSLYQTIMGYELGDFAIDVEYKLLKSIDGNSLVSETGGIVTQDSIRSQVEAVKDVGSYILYGSVGNNPLVIDGKGAMWTDIYVNEWGGHFSTDSIGKKAKEQGYTSVQIKDIYDMSMNEYAVNKKSDVYIFFDSNQIKSADPITYDDDGNVIPLSERFNKNEEDIRYSVPADDFTQLNAKFNNGEITQEEYIKAVSDIYQKSIDTYGEIEQGEMVEEPNKPFPTPKKVSENENVRQFVRTILESGYATPEIENVFKEMVVSGALSYTPTSNDATLNVASSNIQKQGYEVAKNTWQRKIGSFAPGADTIATGEALLRLALEHKNTVDVVNLAADLAELGTRTGQSLQAFSLLKRMGGMGQLVYVQRCVNKLNKDLEKRFKHKKGGAPFVELNETLAEQLANSTTEADYKVTYSAIMKDIAAQVPSTFLDKWNAWRYMSMLTNPVTHVRNVLGNGVFLPAVRIKDILATGLEKALVKDTSKRTKSVVVKQEYKDFASKDFDVVQDLLTGNGKYNPADEIQKYRKIFNIGFIEQIRKFNNNALEAEDAWFLKKHYQHAMGGYLQAQNINVNNITKEQLDKARSYAMNEAQKATYRDASRLATAISQISNASKVGNVLIEGILPFKKTPINIIKRGLEYSPVGLVSTLARTGVQLYKKELNVSQMIDGLAAGLTGTGVCLVGALLGSLGIAKGSFDDEDEWFRKLNGEQEYSIELFGHSYTVDWAAPSSIPFFIGVALSEYDADEDADVFSQIYNFGMAGFEPILNLSLLSGLEDVISSVSYTNSNKVTALAGSALGSYFSQALPTIAGRTANVIDDTRRTTYVDKNSLVPEVIQIAWDKIASKTPFVSLTRAEYIDAWGNTKYQGNFVQRFIQQYASPGYASVVNSTQVSNEINRLYKQTGETSVFPSTPKKYTTIKGTRKDYTEEEYYNYATVRGQSSADYVNEAINHSSYAKLSDENKAKLLDKLYDYADKSAKLTLSYSYEEVAAMQGGEDVLTRDKYNRLSDKAKQILVEEYIMEGYIKAHRSAQNGNSVVDYYIRNIKSNN